MSQVSQWTSRPAQQTVGHFGDESFQAITCTGTNNKNKQEKIYHITKRHYKTNKLTNRG